MGDHSRYGPVSCNPRWPHENSEIICLPCDISNPIGFIPEKHEYDIISLIQDHIDLLIINCFIGGIPYLAIYHLFCHLFMQFK